MKARYYFYIAAFLIVSWGLSLWFGTPTIESFFGNLSSEIIGIFITVLLIEGFILYREKEKWKNVNSKTLDDIAQVCFSLINKIAVSFNVPRELFNEENIDGADRQTQNQEIIRFLEEELTDDLIVERVNNTPDRAIIEFKDRIELVLNNLNTTLSIFHDRLEPQILNTLLNIRRTLSTTITYIQFAITNPNDLERYERNFNADLSGRIASLRDNMSTLLTTLNNKINYSELQE